MTGLGRQATVLSMARIANYGLMLISPIILVRILPVEQFGQYREFVLYASFLQLFAAFSFNESLLYFVPANARSPWHVVRQTNLLTAVSSLILILAVVVIDVASGGKLVGRYLVPLSLYVLFFVNLDIWEHYLLATHQPGKVFAYSGVRLMARMLVVIVAAIVTSNVQVIIWSLVGMELVRLLLSAAFIKALDTHKSEPEILNSRVDQLRYCLPAGLAMVLYLINRNMGNLAVAKLLGPVALAHYSIGTYGEYVYLAIGNSISSVLLPEMVRRDGKAAGGGLALWKDTTIVYCVLMFPAAILLARFAEPIILTVFSAKYYAAIIVLQIHVLFMIRACFDFSPALRAINRTRPLVYSNTCALFVNAGCIALLLPRYGIAGVVAALVISSVIEALVLAAFTIRFYDSSVRELLPWRGIGRVAAAALLSALIIVPGYWVQWLGFGGVVLGSAVYMLIFFYLLRRLGIDQIQPFVERIAKMQLALISGLRRIVAIAV